MWVQLGSQSHVCQLINKDRTTFIPAECFTVSYSQVNVCQLTSWTLECMCVSVQPMQSQGQLAQPRVPLQPQRLRKGKLFIYTTCTYKKWKRKLDCLCQTMTGLDCKSKQQQASSGLESNKKQPSIYRFLQLIWSVPATYCNHAQANKYTHLIQYAQERVGRGKWQQMFPVSSLRLTTEQDSKQADGAKPSKVTDSLCTCTLIYQIVFPNQNLLSSFTVYKLETKRHQHCIVFCLSTTLALSTLISFKLRFDYRSVKLSN